MQTSGLHQRKVILRPSSAKLKTSTICRPQKELEQQFQLLIEKCSESIIPFLDSSSLQSFRKTSRVCFYHVQAYQVWNMMLGDVINEDKKNTQQMKISTISTQKSLNNSDLGESKLQLDPSQLEKQSYLKNSFYSKFDALSRPSTEQKVRRPDVQQNQIWLKKPLNYMQLVSQSKSSILRNRNLIEPNRLFMNDDDLKNIVDIWILNLKQLQNQIKIETFDTDSLVQEVTIWVEVVKLINSFQLEFKEEHVVKILQALQQRQILDIALERKYKTFTQLRESIQSDFAIKNQYATLLDNKLKSLLQSLVNSKLLKFFDIYEPVFKFFDQTLKNDQLTQVFLIRSEQLMMKLNLLVIQKMKDAYFKLSWTVEFKNISLNISIMEKFVNYIQGLIKRHEYSGQFIKIENLKFKHLQNAKYFEHVKRVVSDILKMTKLNHKLKTQYKDQQVPFFERYECEQDPFELFEMSSLALWRETYISWKSKYHKAKQIEPDSVKDDQQKDSEDESQQGFFQTTVSWNIS